MATKTLQTKTVMNTRTIQVTMFKCTSCPYLKHKMAVGYSCFHPIQKKQGYELGERYIRNSPYLPEIPEWCPLSKTETTIF